MSALAQMDLFDIRPAMPPRMPATPPAVKRREYCPIVIGGLPQGKTGDLPTLVVDGIKHLAYHVL